MQNNSLDMFLWYLSSLSSKMWPQESIKKKNTVLWIVKYSDFPSEIKKNDAASVLAQDWTQTNSKHFV